MPHNLQQLSADKEDALRAARGNEATFRDIADAASDGIWVSDAQHKITYLSDQFTDVTGLRIEDVMEEHIAVLLAPETFHDDRRGLFLDPRAPLRDMRCVIAGADGRRATCRAAGKPVLSPAGQFNGYRGSVTDITNQVKAEEKAQHLAFQDALMGLPNRTLLADRMRQPLISANREDGSLAVICLDRDRFKEVNDTLGHSVGDALLRVVARRLLGLTRKGDTVSRLGGDAFVSVRANAHQPTDADNLCRRILESLSRAP